MGSREWDSFATNLAGMLHRTPVESVVELTVGTRFLYFFPGYDAGGHYLGVEVCDDISESGREYLADAAWYAPYPGDFHWRREIRKPDAVDYRKIWLVEHRRLVRDYETRPDHHEAMVYLAAIHTLTRRLAHNSRPAN
ncbi:hypothetical protein [Nocardia sp. NBC_00511]|uniref:hypothetical protein n=1 Tax=Nocardia sp. NBC_00511 TaxID=2903591 RepID=UPI0030E5F39F